jgi:hypothetical protein
MKQTTAAVINLINAARAASDSAIVFAECFTFITTTGATYTWTTVDYEVVFNGFTFNAAGPLVSGLKYKGYRSGSKSISSRSPSQRVPQTSSTARRFSSHSETALLTEHPFIGIGSFSQGRWDLLSAESGYSKDGYRQSIMSDERRPR